MTISKFKKIVSLLLVVTFLITTSSTVFAASNIDVSSVKSTNISKADYDKAINTIETKYLIVNEDGTFSIDPAAKKVIDNQILNDLISGMNGINTMIEKGDLYTDKSSSDPVVKRTKNKMSIMTATVTYIYHWYGFDAIENAEMAARQQLVFEQAANNAALLAIPLGMAWTPSLLASGLQIWIISTWANTCAQGALANGVIVFCFGSPSAPLIYSVQLR
ncbi:MULTISPECIES: hypothetical protein [Dehalobacter]|uniref:Uncharacterized protein n=1 Tax=Dehalobacter restrictus (strain DSM 9455 / PER-K23) TaxID=871738 RepID=A0ABN4BW32_DEHRP|nr:MULTISPECIES: hypothetical protein [Dehalobacter]AHF11399.1 hypothetical protein DEHRE_10025 [Dehalobacter restrictus DSM 9455]MDJ0304917.1 hypothetical protein [Dehalobacter sp.]